MVIRTSDSKEILGLVGVPLHNGGRTIEERLEEILETLDNTSIPVPPSVVRAYNLTHKLQEDFQAEGIAGRTVKETTHA